MEQGKERGEQRARGEWHACGEQHARGEQHACGAGCARGDRSLFLPAPLAVALAALAALALAATLVFAGFLVCLAPVTTRLLAQATSMDDVSPYTRAELVELACATLDYTMGAHDEEALLRAEAQALAAAAADGRCAFAADWPAGAESLAALAAPAASVADLRAALAGLPDTLVLPDEALAHLDDCYAVVSVAVPALGAVAAGAVALLVACGALGGRRRLGAALTAGGGLVLAAFAVLGAWALLDFQVLFAAFHSLFFAEGTWKFSWDSLLICMYPDAFWTGMAAVWAATTAACSAACVAVGCGVCRSVCRSVRRDVHGGVHFGEAAVCDTVSTARHVSR